MNITYEEAEARYWLEKRLEQERQELKQSQDRSRSGDYDFY